MNNILVTGGAGFIGSHLVDRLRQLGCKVQVADIQSDPRIDIRDLASRVDLRHPEIIYHLAAVSRIQESIRYPLATYDVNVMGTVNVLEFARIYGANVVFVSSACAGESPALSSYAITKRAGEECCRFYAECYGLNTVCARPFNVYGPGCPGGDGGLAMGIWERQYREGKPLAITGNGSNVRDFVHVSDIVEGLLILGEKTWKGDIFDLGTGHGEKVRNVAGMFGCPIEFIGARDGEAPQSVANAWRTRQLTGWKAKINISDYIRSFTT